MTTKTSLVLPEIIQGGMGVYISSPFLALEVTLRGGLGTVSGVAPDRILAFFLQSGDPGGNYRRAISHFPYPHIARRVLDAYYIEEGNPKKLTRAGIQMYSVEPSALLISLIIVANFAFIWLAKEGHNHPVSINYLEKIAMPHIYAIVGAMIAGVDVITMGAGIPIFIPEVIKALTEGRELKYPTPVIGDKEMHWMTFNPEKFFGEKLHLPKKPKFLPIISSNTLAKFLVKRLKDQIFGFVVEEPTAGGHNAPPRNNIIGTNGEYVYNEDDLVHYPELAKLGYPFWIGGSYASPEKLAWAQSQGANGIQVGTIFALANESGMDPNIKAWVRRQAFRKQLQITTSVTASPTGYPFKVAVVDGSLSSQTLYESRERICNQGALRTPYRKPSGVIGYRCSAEPVAEFVKKGGKAEDTRGVKCVCNGLFKTAGMGDPNELSLVTLGDDTSFLPNLMLDENSSYSVSDVFRYLVGPRYQKHFPDV